MKLYILVLLVCISNYSQSMHKAAKIASIDMSKEKRGIGNAHTFEITPELLKEVTELEEDVSSCDENIDELLDDQLILN